MELWFFFPYQWLCIKDTFTVLPPFEEETTIMSCNNAGFSFTIRVVFLLENTLCYIIDRAQETQQKEENLIFLISQGPDTIPVRPVGAGGA